MPRSFFSRQAVYVKGGPLHGAHLHPNTNGIQVIHDGLTNLKERRNRHQFPRVEALRRARLRQQLLRLLWIIGKWLDRQGKVHQARHDDPGGRTVTQTRRLTDGLPIQGIVHRQAYALVRPH